MQISRSRSLIVLLAASVLAASGAALAQPPSDTAGPARYGAGVSEPPLSNLNYQTGAYFYGNDCGGNSVMTSAPVRANRPGGVILSGAAGQDLAYVLNCDDRRNALASYRDAFQGAIGRAYVWRNPNGAANGHVVAMRRYQNGTDLCTNFRATATVNQSAANSTGTACRLQDGNWHMQ